MLSLILTAVGAYVLKKSGFKTRRSANTVKRFKHLLYGYGVRAPYSSGSIII